MPGPASRVRIPGAAFRTVFGAGPKFPDRDSVLGACFWRVPEGSQTFLELPRGLSDVSGGSGELPLNPEPSRRAPRRLLEATRRLP